MKHEKDSDEGRMVPHVGLLFLPLTKCKMTTQIELCEEAIAVTKCNMAKIVNISALVKMKRIF